METLQRTANRGSISTGYDIDNSLKLEPDNSEFLSITNTSAGNRRTATYSFWLKRTELDASSYMQVAGLFTSSETTRFMFYQDHIMLENGNGGTRKRLTTNAVYRDTSAFYHFVVAIDTTQSTAANRVKLYVNGVQETSFSTEEYPDQNFDLSIGQSGANFPWRYGAYNATYYKTAGYLAEAHYIDGTQYAASDFGEFDEDSGIWKPKEFTGNYGTQGSYLNFSDASNLGANPKGSDIDAVLTNITSADQATDTPTNNFCTLNPLGEKTGSAAITEGATKIDNSGTASWETAYSSIGVTSGKWYAEVTPQLGSFNTVFGIVNFDTAIHDGSTYNNAGYWLGNFDSGSSIYYYFNGSGAGSIVVNVTAGVVIGLALDLDNNTLDFYVNGSQNKQATSLPSGTYGFIADVQGTGGPYIQCNFGGYTVNTISSGNSDENGYGNFEYAPPSGYYALCTKNLAEYG
jgi:hypothetical protein